MCVSTVCVSSVCVLKKERGGARRRRDEEEEVGGGGGSSPKSKNPTQRCGEKFSTIKSAVKAQNDSINSWTNAHAQDSRPLHRSPSFCHTSITLQGKSKATTVARARI